MNQIDKVLAERGKRYGDFADHAVIAQDLQDVMRRAGVRICGESWDKLSAVQKQALTVIADKIARILSGDPNYDDNWIDIQGYAKLAQDRLPKQGELFDVRPQAEQVQQEPIRNAALVEHNRRLGEQIRQQERQNEFARANFDDIKRRLGARNADEIDRIKYALSAPRFNAGGFMLPEDRD